MWYELFIAGMNGKAWVKLKRSLMIARRRFSVIASDGAEKKVSAPAILRSDGAIQPVVRVDGKPVLQTPDGLLDCIETVGGSFVIQTKELPDGSLQYVRRTGHVGVAPKEAAWLKGKPKVGQWRVHPAELVAKTSFTRAKRPTKPPIELPDGATLAEG